jgi:hypothetical protein
MAKKGMPVAEALEHLGLTTDASEADVKQSYKDLARIWHPDRFQSDERLEKKAEEQIKVINEARSVALKYVKKHGHFRFVNKGRAGTTTQPPPPPPPPRQEPKPPPKQERSKTQQGQPRTEKTQEPKPPPPPPQEEYRPPPEPESEYETYTDHMPGQNIIIASILIVILGGFIFLMMSTMGGDSRKEKVEAYLAKREEMKKSPLERRVIVLDEEDPGDTINKSALEEETAFLDTFFTLGTDKELVSLIQGAPFQIKGDVWKYGFSTITFKNDKVVGWKSSELHPLNVGMPPPNPDDEIEYVFGVGTTKKEVAAMYGAPDVINGDLWTYGEAYIRFKADTIIFWQNDKHNTFDIEFEENIKRIRVYVTPEDTLAKAKEVR